MSRADQIRMQIRQTALDDFQKRQAVLTPRLPSIRRFLVEYIREEYPVVSCEDTEAGILVRFNEIHGLLSDDSIIRKAPVDQEHLDVNSAQHILSADAAISAVLHSVADHLRRQEVHSKFRLYTLTAEESERVRKFCDYDDALRQNFAALRTAAELHFCISKTDVSEGLDQKFQSALRNPTLDRGTALNLLVNLYLIEIFEDNDWKSSESDHSLIVELFERLESGFYQTEIFRYVPDEDQLKDGEPDFSRFTRKVPEWMFQPIEGQYDGVYDPVSDEFTVT